MDLTSVFLPAFVAGRGDFRLMRPSILVICRHCSASQARRRDEIEIYDLVAGIEPNPAGGIHPGFRRGVPSEHRMSCFHQQMPDDDSKDDPRSPRACRAFLPPTPGLPGRRAAAGPERSDPNR